MKQTVVDSPEHPPANQNQETDVMTLFEAAAFLRCHSETLRRRAIAWGVPHKRLGQDWRFSRTTLTRWMQE